MKGCNGVPSVALLVVAAILKQVETAGTLDLYFRFFDNVDGTGANGNCCESMFPCSSFFAFDKGYCDPFFKICASTYYTSNCEYGQTTTSHIKNRNLVSFENTIANVSNPIKYSFTQYKGLHIKIFIYDKDNGRNDFITSYDFKVTLKMGAPYQMITRGHNSKSIGIKMKIYCSSYYYGERCDVYCKPTVSYGCSERGAMVCNKGYVFANKKCERIDHCKSSPCHNDAPCTSTSSSYSCACHPGYVGRRCQVDVNECESNPCSRHSRCVQGVDSFECDCMAGYEGPRCDRKIDACVGNTCHARSVCVDRTLSYECACPAGFTGSMCALETDECASAPCANNGSCVDMENGYSCECRGRYEGVACERRIDDCAPNPCRNRGRCANTDDGFECECEPGFVGVTCDVNVDECISEPCQNEGACVDEPNGFACLCRAGFEGVLCQLDVDECVGNVCRNGTCVDDVNGYTCDCEPGFEGILCEIQTDECLSNPCVRGACVDQLNGFECSCPSGYSDAYCSTAIDTCAESAPCQHNSTCVTEVAALYRCVCERGWYGKDCELEHICEGADNPCENLSRCMQQRVGPDYACVCPVGEWTGQNCTTKVECHLACLNGGSCSVKHDSTNETCLCINGYHGDVCEHVTTQEHIFTLIEEEPMDAEAKVTFMRTLASFIIDQSIIVKIYNDSCVTVDGIVKNTYVFTLERGNRTFHCDAETRSRDISDECNQLRQATQQALDASAPASQLRDSLECYFDVPVAPPSGDLPPPGGSHGSQILEKRGLGKGAIISIVTICLLIVIAVLVILYIVRKRRVSKSEDIMNNNKVVEYKNQAGEHDTIGFSNALYDIPSNHRDTQPLTH